MYRNYQIGGGLCSMCNAPGVNKSTCPLNPYSKNPKPLKHNAIKTINAIKAIKPIKLVKETKPVKPSKLMSDIKKDALKFRTKSFLPLTAENMNMGLNADEIVDLFIKKEDEFIDPYDIIGGPPEYIAAMHRVLVSKSTKSTRVINRINNKIKELEKMPDIITHEVTYEELDTAEQYVIKLKTFIDLHDIEIIDEILHNSGFNRVEISTSKTDIYSFLREDYLDMMFGANDLEMDTNFEELESQIITLI